MFEGLEKIGYLNYLKKYPFHNELGINLSDYVKSGRVEHKRIKSPLESVDFDETNPLQAELDDLIRLHFLIRSRKVTTALEFGVGYSTKVIDHALSLNKKEHSKFVKKNLRKINAFECHSVDNYKKWIKKTKNKYKLENTFFYYSKCITTTFNGKICTMYSSLPNICPDFIYLDAPDQFGSLGNVRGISTRHIERMPMSADILAIEHFLLPGTLIVVDGRTANARFLKTNFQRNWDYKYFKEFDQHFFELNENPLGIWNDRQIKFSR
jgi:hypothetical protein